MDVAAWRSVFLVRVSRIQRALQGLRDADVVRTGAGGLTVTRSIDPIATLTVGATMIISMRRLPHSALLLCELFHLAPSIPGRGTSDIGVRYGDRSCLSCI
jgi:hypothetical protein